MGKAQIIENKGGGNYTVRILYNTAPIIARQSSLTAELTKLDAELLAATTSREQAELALVSFTTALNTGIEALRAAITAPDKAAAIAALTATIAAATPGKLALAKAKNVEISIKIKIAETSSHLASATAAILAASEDVRDVRAANCESGHAAGNIVDTVEINGEEGEIEIAAEAPLPGSILTQPAAISTATWARAFALHPYWQKWNPTVRKGVVVAVNADETVTVIYYDAVSRYQGLNINQTLWAENVPVAFWLCDPVAGGDEVLVQFDGQDWGRPVVIGKTGLGHDFFLSYTSSISSGFTMDLEPPRAINLSVSYKSIYIPAADAAWQESAKINMSNGDIDWLAPRIRLKSESWSQTSVIPNISTYPGYLLTAVNSLNPLPYHKIEDPGIVYYGDEPCWYADCQPLIWNNAQPRNIYYGGVFNIRGKVVHDYYTGEAYPVLAHFRRGVALLFSRPRPVG